MTELDSPIDSILIANENDEQKKRGGCLSTFLIFMIIANTSTSIYYLVSLSLEGGIVPNMPLWSVYLLLFFGILNTAFGVAVWKWKKIGVYGFVGSAIIIFGVNVTLGINIFTALFGLVGPAILIILVKPLWNYLD